MIAVACDWGGDISVGPGGDIRVIPAQADVKDRIIRRLLTNSGDYVWHTGYGAGLGGYVGKPFSSGSIEGAILTQLELEALVVTQPSPKVSAECSRTAASSAISVSVQYQTVGVSAMSTLLLNLDA